MKRIITAAVLLMLAVLLAGCAAELPAPIPDGAPGHASQDIGLTTDGQRVYLLRQGATWRSWSFTFSAYEVTGGGLRRIVSGRDADDFTVAEGRLLIASHTANWLKAVWDSAEIDGYDARTGKTVMHASEREPGGVNPDRYAFYIAGARIIRSRSTYRPGGERWEEFAFVDAQGRVEEPFWTLPGFLRVKVLEGCILTADYEASEVRLFDLNGMKEYTVPAMWGTDSFGAPLLPDGVLLEGVLYYPAADGVRAYDLTARQDSLFAAVTAPEYFYVTDGLLYTVADDGLLTAFELRTGEARPTAVVLTKADRFVIAATSAYILQKPELHGVRQTGCRIEALWEAE